MDEAGEGGQRPLQPHGQLVFILALTLALAYVDRQLLVVLIEPVKRDLSLSDTQIGILTGAAFSLVYATLGIPVARLADRTSRRNVLSISVAVWAVMTCLCGAAQNVWQMIVARMGVGAGESGCIPPAHSLIASVVPAKKLSRAMAAYSVGVPAGVLIGMVVGGWLGELVGWRLAFLVIGLTGLPVALLVRFGVKEPLRAAAGAAAEPPPKIGAALKATLGTGPLFLVLLGSGLLSIGVGALLTWTPSLLARTTGLGLGAIGSWLGLVIGLGGAAGMLLGGVIADRAAARGPRWRMMMPAAFGLLAAIGALVMLQQTSATGVLILLMAPILFGMAPTGVTNAIVQTLTPPSLRAFSSSLLVFANTAFGLALGPLIIGLISDALGASGQGGSLKTALLVVPAFFLAGALSHLAAALRFGDADRPSVSSAS